MVFMEQNGILEAKRSSSLVREGKLSSEPAVPTTFSAPAGLGMVGIG
jgi:hypothetical protein